MVKATPKKTADVALKYYFEMLGLPLTASEGEVMAAYDYFQKEQAPGLYTPGSSDQKKAEAKQAELKFAFEKLAKWFKENPDSNISPGEHFRFDGNAEQWQQHQALEWAEKLKEYRAQESEVWEGIQKERKRMRSLGFLHRTKIMLTIVCALALSGQGWHKDWNKQFRRIQSENLMVEARGDFMQRENDPQAMHDRLMDKAYRLKDEWTKDDDHGQSAQVCTWILSFLVALWWIPEQGWKEITDAYKKYTAKKKVA